MLAFYHSLDASKNDHTKEMNKKGIDKIDRMNTGKRPRRNTWMSYFAQLLPGINLGPAGVVLTPKALQKDYQDLYYKFLILPLMSSKTGKERMTLPERYQGVGLPDFQVHALLKKLHFLQQKMDGMDSTSKITGATYKAFMVEVGTYGNICSRS